MEHKQLIELIDRYLAGNCTAEEIRTVEQWYVSQMAVGGDFYQGDKKALTDSTTRSLSVIRARLGIDKEETEIQKLGSYGNIQKWLAAACILVLLSVGAVVYFNNTQKELSYTTVKTQAGQVKQVKLPDSTEVWLNAGSTLKYSSEFNQKNRQVYLDGEAFFDVAHNKKKPFDIYSGKIKTRVIGTAFSVSAYAGSLINAVTVVRGKVQVRDATQVLANLVADQELEYTISTQKGSVINVSSDKVVSWKEGKLAFTDMPMQDIAIHLQKWYGVNFVFKNQKLTSTRFTASFDNRIKLNDLLAVMYEVNNFKYRLDEKAKTVTYF